VPQAQVTFMAVDRSAASDASGLYTIRRCSPVLTASPCTRPASLTTRSQPDAAGSPERHREVKLGLAGAGRTNRGAATQTVQKIPEWAALPGFDDPDAGHSGFKAIA
jgi:hypothetical protein